MVQRIKVYAVGVGMTKFEKPGRRQNFDYPDMAKEAVIKALKDTRVGYHQVKAVCVGYVYGDSTCGQRAIYEVGLTGCPIYNINNNCATGSTALMMAKQIIEAGNADCVLALGFEKMERGSLSSKFFDRTSPLGKHVKVMANIAVTRKKFWRRNKKKSGRQQQPQRQEAPERAQGREKDRPSKEQRHERGERPQQGRRGYRRRDQTRSRSPRRTHVEIAQNERAFQILVQAVLKNMTKK